MASSPIKSRAKRAELEQEQSRGAGDPSILRPPISVTVTGMKQALRALSSGSQEVCNITSRIISISWWVSQGSWSCLISMARAALRH